MLRWGEFGSMKASILERAGEQVRREMEAGGAQFNATAFSPISVVGEHAMGQGMRSLRGGTAGMAETFADVGVAHFYLGCLYRVIEEREIASIEELVKDERGANDTEI